MSSLQAGFTEKQEIATAITNTIHQQLANYRQAMAIYEPVVLYENCVQLCRIIGEMGLYANGLNDLDFWDYRMLSINLADEQHKATITNIRQQISDHISPEVGNRFYTFVQMCASIHQGFIKNGVYDHISVDAHMHTIGGILRYFEKRSTFLKTTLSLIPHICRGEQKFDFTETLQHLLYPIETC